MTTEASDIGQFWRDGLMTVAATCHKQPKISWSPESLWQTAAECFFPRPVCHNPHPEYWIIMVASHFKKAGEAAMTSDERRLRKIAQFNAVACAAAKLGMWHFDVKRNRLDCSDEILALLGIAGDEWGGTPEALEAIVHPEDVERFRRFRAGGLARGHFPEYDYRIVRPDGEIRWIYVRGNTIRDSAGQPVEAYGVMMDVTERKRAELALHESEQRFRVTFDNAAVGIAHVGPDGSLLRVNERLCQIVGWSAAELTTKTFQGITHPDDVAPNVALLKQVLDGEIDQYVMEKRYVRKDGSIVWTNLTVACVRKNDGAVDYFISVVEDITARKRHEEQVELLMREVNHRAKNLLTVVLTIARRASRQHNPEEFARKFEQRIKALAASHDLLVRNAWQGIDLFDLVCSQLAHFKDLIGERIVVNGPPIRLRPAAAQAIGMAVHELSTNASKHGALSCPHGSVRIGWDLLTDEARLRMTWREEGGAAPSLPTTPGFGHTVLVDMVRHALDAEVELVHDEDGLVWSLVAPAEFSLETAAG